MGHNLVPHQHHLSQADQEQCFSQKDQPQSWLEILSSIFHPDLGADHLEDLRQSEKNNFNLNAYLLSSEADFSFPLVLIRQLTSQYTRPLDLALPDYLVTTLRSLRSPPALR